MIIRRTSLPILTEEANREGEPERGLLEGPASQSGIPQIREGCWIEAEVLFAAGGLFHSAKFLESLRRRLFRRGDDSF